MKLIKSSYQIIKPTGYTIDDVYKSIELAGRVSHKSEDKITEDSAKAFVGRMLNMKHLATCEFGTVYLEYHVQDPSVIGEPNYHKQQEELNSLIKKYANNKYSCIKVNHYYDTVFITSNYRVLVENNWLGDLRYLCIPTSFHERRYTVKFICDRGVTHEFVRHRPFSFMQESTRYCNYSKGKFNNELTFIIPEWLDIEEQHYKYDYSFVDQKWMGPNNTEVSYQWLDTNGHVWYPDTDEHLFLKSLSDSEEIYFKLLEQGWKPQQARAILPNALKTELYMCGFAEDWKHFCRLRDDKQHAHPQAYELAHPLHEEFIKRGYV